MANDELQWTFRVSAQPSPYAGAYWIGGVGIGIGLHLKHRPIWLHRWTMWLWFGWKWEDEPVT
jgi:hypothetical protein